jgi:hypothetical protein
MSEGKRSVRYYIVTEKADGAQCLVEASNQAQAFRRASEHYCTARPATAADAVALMSSGADIIRAPKEPEQLEVEYAIEESKGGDPVDAEPNDVKSPPPDQAKPFERLRPHQHPPGRIASEVFGPGFTGSSDNE